ncbi:hypothetical protein CPC08DRAFT_816217 [Agrocybe pediades]|nr:hypothetical protein CPC08DRAFT_816217 [Agrocybe pediades]
MSVSLIEMGISEMQTRAGGMGRMVDIEVAVIGGREFLNSHSFRPNPSYYLRLNLSGEEKRTPGCKGSNTPRWDQKFVFAANLDSILQVEVLCIHGHTREDHVIGQADINILTVERNKDVEIAFHSKAKKSEEKVTTGYITLHLRVALPVTFAVQESKAGLRSLNYVNQMGKAVKIMNEIDGEQLAPAWNRLVTSLDKVALYAEKISDLDSRAAVAVSAVAFMVQVLVKQIERDEKVERLGVIMADLYTYIQDGIEMDKIITYQKTLDKVLTQTTECAYFIADYRKVKIFAQRAVVNTVSDADGMIAQFEASFGELKISLILGSSLQTAVVSYRILRTVEHIESLIHIYNLPYLRNVGWDSGRTCLRGTRQDLIDEILEWTSTSSNVARASAKHICVLAGPPGCGKSTIAHTISQAFHEQKRLGASLFLQGHSGPTVNSQTVSSSIIHQVAGYNASIKARITDVLKSDPSLATADIGQQFRYLLVGAISSGATKDEAALAMIRPTLIVLDGLHEISDQREQNRILTAMADYFVQLPPNFRLLLTSQEGDMVTDVLGRVSQHCHIRHITFDTPGGEPIEEFMSTSLERLASEIPELEEKYSLEELQQSLMERSLGVQTWIDTLFRFLFYCHDHKESFPGTCDTLQKVLSTPVPLWKEDGMDNLYRVICSSILYPTNLIRDLLFSFIHSIGTLSLSKAHRIISLACNLHDVVDLAHTKCPILEALQELGLMVGRGKAEKDENLFDLNPAFQDFLTNERRCHGTPFFVDPTGICKVATARVKVMNEELRPFLRKSGSEMTHDCPPEGLQHASSTWVFCIELCGVGCMAQAADYSLLLTTLDAFILDYFFDWTQDLAKTKPSMVSVPMQVIFLQMLERWLDVHHRSSTSTYAFKRRLSRLISDVHIKLRLLPHAKMQIKSESGDK